MKIYKTPFIALVFTLCFAQDKTSYEYDNILLSTALDSIRNQFEVAIIYQDNHVRDIFISATCTECNEYEALSALLMNTSLIWQKVGNQYIISKNGLKKKRSAINGFIREDATGEPISYANVFLKDSRYGNVSNSDGYYVITDIYPGEYTLIVSFMGYEKKEISIVLGKGKNLRQDHRLVKMPIEADEIIVSAERQKFLDMVEPSQITLDVREVSAMPAFIEADIFRAIQLLPGVHTLNDFTSALYVRGGTPDQNLILLDGINVYHPFHLGGIFSTFNTDAIKEADFRSGGFPVKYGGRMGSVLMIKNREGNTEAITGKTNISILSSKAMIEGPLPDYKGIKGSWMLAGRRTYFDRIVKAGLDIADYVFRDNQNWEKDLPGFPYYFYDLEGKINLDLNNNHRLTLSSYFGDDILAVNVENTSNYIWQNEGQINEWKNYNREKIDWRWGNFINSATWRWLISPELILKAFVANSQFRFAINMDDIGSGWDKYAGDTTYYQNENYFDAFDKINDKTLETELTWLPSIKHTITVGYQYKEIDFDLGLISASGSLQDSGFVLYADTSLWITHRPSEQSVYFQDKWMATKKLSFQAGARLYRYSLHDTLYFEPRLGLKYFIKENLSLKVSMGRYHQFLTIVNPPDMNFAYVDLWMPIPEDRAASHSDHFVLGLEYITDENILFRIEAYKKTFNNLLTLNDEKIEFEQYDNWLSVNPFNDFWDTQGRAHGIEILIKKQTGKIRGWIGYTYSSIEKKTIKHDWYHPNYDRTHALNLVGDWQWTERTHASIAITYMSGNPYTPILGRTENIIYSGYNHHYWSSRYLLGEKNSQRYPPYFRCDVGLSKRKDTKYGAREWYFDILNVTNHMNVLMYFYEYSSRKKEGLKTYKEKSPGIYRFGMPMFPITPTFGWRIEF